MYKITLTALSKYLTARKKIYATKMLITANYLCMHVLRIALNEGYKAKISGNLLHTA